MPTAGHSAGGGDRRLPLVGRADELAAALAVIEAGASPGGRLIGIEGMAGSGKSRLADEVADLVARRGFRLTRGVARPAPQHEDLSAIAAAPPSDRRLLVVAEDLHWADASTLAALHRIVAAGAGAPVVLLTWRPHPRPPGLRELSDIVAARGAGVTLGPLEPGEVHALAAHALDARPGPRLRRELARAGGNPYFVLELLAALERHGGVRVAEEAEIVRHAEPASVPLAAVERLNFLPADSLEVLRFASVFGRTFSAARVAALVGRSIAALSEPLRIAVAAGAVEAVGTRLAFRHDVVRAALHADLPPSLRAALHREAASALALLGSPPREIAEHLLEGAEPGDPEAVEWLQRAARDTGARAPVVAVRLLERAAELAGGDDPGRAALDADLVPLLVRTGRVQEAERLSRELLIREGDVERAARLRVGLARALVVQGRAAETIDVAGEALADAETPPTARTRLRIATSAARMLLADAEGARRCAEAAYDLAQRSGDGAGECASGSLLARQALEAGELGSAVALATAAVRTGERDRSRSDHRHEARVVLSLALTESDRLDDAAAALRLAQHVASGPAAPVLRAEYHSALATNAFLAGDWDQAVAAAEASVASGRGAAFAATAARSHIVSARVALHRGDLASTARELHAANRAARRTGRTVRPLWLTQTQAAIAAASGRDEQALVLLEEGWRAAAAVGWVVEPGFALDLVAQALRAGREDLAVEVTQDLEARAAREETPRLRAAARRARGRCARDIDALRSAAEALRSEAAPPLALAHACHEAGVALIAAGSRTAGIGLVGEAAATYQRLGAALDRARMEATLRTLGVYRTAAAADQVASFAAALTATERRILDLVAQGLSNQEVAERLFVSRNTVRTHVSHILAKLGLSSRTELIRLAAAASPERGWRGDHNIIRSDDAGDD